LSKEIAKPSSGELPETRHEDARAVYFPACISRTMGPLPGEDAQQSIIETLKMIADRANSPVWIPPDSAGYCCGMPFSSKGYRHAYKQMINRTVSRFYDWSDSGRLPIVMDTSPCTFTVKNCFDDLDEENREKFKKLTILDSIEFVHDYLLTNLSVHKLADDVVLHPVCSVTKMDLTDKLAQVTRTCANSAEVPVHYGCCAFAGDRGFLFPELTESATKAEAVEVGSKEYDGYYSSSRTCEIGMTRATDKVYQSFLYLVEKATRK